MTSMTHSDDREAFEAEKQRNALALGEDAEVFDLALRTVVAADRHRYTYLWSWMGVPIIQMPADIAAMQEVIWTTKPDVIIETGVARGGSVIFSASMLMLIGKGMVIGIDIDIRAHNRDMIERHPMASRITLIEGSSIDAGNLGEGQGRHSRGRVGYGLSRLRSFARPCARRTQRLWAAGDRGTIPVRADTVLGRMTPEQTPKARSKIWLPGNEPLAAVEAYLRETDRFEPDPVINGKMIVASSPGGYLRCVHALRNENMSGEARAMINTAEKPDALP